MNRIKIDASRNYLARLSSYSKQSAQGKFYKEIQTGRLSKGNFTKFLTGVRNGGYEAGRQDQWEQDLPNFS